MRSRVTFNSSSFPVAVLVSALLVSCSFLPEREEANEPEMPPEFSEEGTRTESGGAWWKDFQSPELDRLITDALAANYDLAQARARLLQARAAAVISGSERYPELDLGADASFQRSRSDGQTVDTENYSLGLAAGYEIDLWGRLRATANQAESLVEASIGDRDAAVITLAAEVTDRWLEIIELKNRIELIQNQLETNRTYLDLLIRRQRKGLTSALAVFQQEQIVAATESLMPLREAELAGAEYELAVLLGRPPRSPLHLKSDQMPGYPPLPPIGLPADLLRNRPDIRAAAARLESADWGAAAARANRLPALTLTGSAGYDSDQFDRLFDDWFAGFAAGILAPLIDGGRRAAEADRTLAVAEERLAAYRQTVLDALREVEDALIREKKQTAYLDSLEKELTAADNALTQANLRYRKGDSEYLDVLTSLNAVQQLERNLLSARRDLLVYRVSLYRALGSRWKSEGRKPERGKNSEIRKPKSE